MADPVKGPADLVLAKMFAKGEVPAPNEEGRSRRPALPENGVVSREGIKDRDLAGMVDSLNKLLEIARSEVRFSLFRDPDTIVVKVVEHGTGRLIREMPSEKILQIVHSFLELMGLLVDEKV